MLPVLAFVLAIASAVAADFLPGVPANYKIGGVCYSGGTTVEDDCVPSTDANFTKCTVKVSGQEYPAFEPGACSTPLRQIPQ